MARRPRPLSIPAVPAVRHAQAAGPVPIALAVLVAVTAVACSRAPSGDASPEPERIARLEQRVAALEQRLAAAPSGVASLDGADFAELAARLGSDDALERLRAGEALGPRLAELRLDALRLLKDGSVRQREAVAIVLASRATPDMTADLVLAQQAAGEARVRTWIDLALGRTGSADALEPLVADLSHPAETVRVAAVEGLARLGDPRAAAPLAQVVGNGTGLAAQSAEAALVRIGEPVAMLLGTTWDAQGPRERRTIVAALQRVPGELVDRFLKERLEDASPLVALEAARVLALRGDMSGRDAAVERLNSDDPSVAHAARAALDAMERAP